MSQGTMVAGGGPRAPPRSCEVPPRDVGGARATTRGGRGDGGAGGGGRRSASSGRRHDACDDEDDSGRRIIPIDDRAHGWGGSNPTLAREGWGGAG